MAFRGRGQTKKGAWQLPPLPALPFFIRKIGKQRFFYDFRGKGRIYEKFAHIRRTYRYMVLDSALGQ
jgi:hypothetical protein